jgi:hypothetical protein
MSQLTAVEPRVRVTVARTERELESLRPAWDTLQGDVHMTDPDFYLTTLRSDPRIRGPWVLVLEREGVPQGMLVGRLEDHEFAYRVGYKTIHRTRRRALTVVYGGALGPAADTDASRLVDELTAALARREADVVLLPNLAVGTPLFEAATRRPGRLSRMYLWRPKTHWRLVLPGSLDELIQSKPSRSRGRLRRYPKRLLQEFDGRWRLDVFRDPEELERLVADAERVAALTYQRGLGVKLADDHVVLGQTRLGMERGWFRGYVLYVDDEPRAYWFGLAYRGVFRTGLTGYDPGFADYHPGTFVLMRMIDDLAHDPEVQTVDYGFGDAEYKHTFGTESWAEADIAIFPPTVAGAGRNLLRTAVAGLEQAGRRIAGSSLRARAKKAWRRRLRRGGTA